MPFIRPFEPRDTEACMHICRATQSPTVAADPVTACMSPYIWCVQFTHLSPQSCFVLVDNTNTDSSSPSQNGKDGKVVGYVIGTPDVHAFATCYPRYIKEVLQSPQGLIDVPPPQQLDTLESWLNPVCLAQLAYNPQWLVLSGPEGGPAEARKKEMVETWRAMLHIDLLEGWQGKGWGRKMIERFVEAVRTNGADYGRGVNLGVAGENKKVVKFYEKVGFRVFEGGEVEGNVWMVRDL
ncbi:acyl-CoA N-acyltransferase [Neurospora intermedia]|uniref:Acyl-CoA N-acyltransferase n=1 Tax=Neurospora intermedia TaxID=5142 RepID=A0ABR3DAE4_NEUIN